MSVSSILHTSSTSLPRRVFNALAICCCSCSETGKAESSSARTVRSASARNASYCSLIAGSACNRRFNASNRMRFFPRPSIRSPQTSARTWPASRRDILGLLKRSRISGFAATKAIACNASDQCPKSPVFSANSKTACAYGLAILEVSATGFT